MGKLGLRREDRSDPAQQPANVQRPLNLPAIDQFPFLPTCRVFNTVVENIRAFRQVLTRRSRAQDCARHKARSQVQLHVRKGDEVASRASSTRTEHRERLKRSPCLRQEGVLK